MPPLKPGTIWPTPEEEEEVQRGIALDPDTREIKCPLVSVAEASPKIVEAYREGRLTIAPHLRKEHPKTRVTIRLDADVVAQPRTDGPGWQTCANTALREAVLGK